MFSVLQRRHERALGGGELLELNVSDPERMLDEFLQTCTVRQVRVLGEIALEEARLQVRLCACERKRDHQAVEMVPAPSPI